MFDADDMRARFSVRTCLTTPGLSFGWPRRKKCKGDPLCHRGCSGDSPEEICGETFSCCWHPRKEPYYLDFYRLLEKANEPIFLRRPSLYSFETNEEH